MNAIEILVLQTHADLLLTCLLSGLERPEHVRVSPRSAWRLAKSIQVRLAAQCDHERARQRRHPRVTTGGPKASLSESRPSGQARASRERCAQSHQCLSARPKCTPGRLFLPFLRARLRCIAVSRNGADRGSCSFTCACESGVSMINLCGPLAALARPSQRPASRREPARRSFSRRRFRSRGYRGDDDTWRGPRASRARAAGPRTRTPRSVEGLPRHVPRTQCRRARSISSSAGVRTCSNDLQASQPAPHRARFHHQFSKTFLIKRRHGSRTDIPRSRHIHT